MMGLIRYLIKEFADLEVKKYTDMAEGETQKLGDILRSSIEDGVHNATARTVPVMMAAGFVLFGAVFLFFGLSTIIDVYAPVQGVGFAVMGIIALIIAAVTGKPR